MSARRDHERPMAFGIQCVIVVASLMVAVACSDERARHVSPAIAKAATSAQPGHPRDATHEPPSTTRTPEIACGDVYRGAALMGSLQLVGLRTKTPVAGYVTATGPVRCSVTVGADGRFGMSLPPGNYELTGHSPSYGSGDYACRAERSPVVLHARPEDSQGFPPTVDVLCPLR